MTEAHRRDQVASDGLSLPDLPHDELLIHREDALVTITLNRPKSRNAITAAMWRALQEVLPSIGRHPDVRVVLFRGTGDRAFSAGADVSEFASTRSSRESARRSFHLIEDTLQQIEGLPQPTIAVLKGYAVGAGCELANACDLRIAAAEAMIGIPAAKRGITIGHGHIRRLVRLVGPARAKDLLFTGRLVNGQEAFHMGLVDYLAPLHGVDGLAHAVASQIAENSPVTLAWFKSAVHRVLDDPALSNIGDDAEASTHYHSSSEFAEGVRAFQEKRTPRF